MKIRAIFAAALLCVVNPAVQAKKYVMPTPVAQELPVEVMLGQHEIEIDTPDNSALSSQFGLIGAIVGAAVSNAQAKTAETRAAEIRNMLVDYNFNASFERALRAKIAAEGLSPNPQVMILDTPWDAYLERSKGAMAEAAKAGKAPATGTVLSIAPRYALDYQLQSVYVRMNVSLIDRQMKPNGKFKEKLLAWRTYSFSVPLDPGHGLKADTNVRRWKAVGGAELARLLDVGVQQTTDMLVYDFSPAGRAEGDRKVAKKESGQFGELKTFGRQLRTGDTWYWTRTKGLNKVMRSINGINPVIGELQSDVATAAPAAAPAATVEQATVPQPAVAPEQVAAPATTAAPEAATAPAAGASL